MSGCTWLGCLLRQWRRHAPVMCQLVPASGRQEDYLGCWQRSVHSTVHALLSQAEVQQPV